MICCDRLESQLRWSCDTHDDPFVCPDALIVRIERGRIVMPIHDGGSSYIEVSHCPWCGSSLTSA
jgi:hypothetical protein